MVIHFRSNPNPGRTPDGTPDNPGLNPSPNRTQDKAGIISRRDIPACLSRVRFRVLATRTLDMGRKLSRVRLQEGVMQP